MNIKKIGITIFLACIACAMSFAQDENPFQIKKGSLLWTVNVGGGYAGVLYENENVKGTSISFDKRNGVIGDFGLNYMLSDVLGVSLGLGYSSYSTQVSIANYTDEKTNIIDSDNMRYNLSVSSGKAVEKHKLSYLDIPIKMLTQMYLTDKIIFEGAIGLKFGIPISTKYELEESNFTTEAFYPDLNFLLTNHAEQGLYTNRQDWHPKGDLESSMNMAVLVEGGVILPVNNKLALSGRAYFSYGINESIEGKKNEHLLEEHAKYNGFQSFLGYGSLMQFGIKIGIIGIL